MPSPRRKVDYDSIAARRVTYAFDPVSIVYNKDEPNGSAAVGLAVTLGSANTVRLCVDGEKVIGKLIKVNDDGFCAVQVEGYMQLPGGNATGVTTAAALTLNDGVVGALGGGASALPGYIRAAGGGANARGFIQDPSVPAETWVYL